VNSHTANAGQNFLRHDVGQQEAGSGQHQTDGGFAMGDLSRFLIFFHFERGFTHQFPFAAQPGVFFADDIEDGGKDDGEDVSDGQNSDSG